MLEDFVRLQCVECGVVFGVLKEHYDNLREYGGFYHCTNGHTRGWSESASKRAERERENQRNKQRVAQLSDEVEQERKAKELAIKATARLRKRAHAGVCPDCNRTFTNMARHMATKHSGLKCDAPKLKVARSCYLPT